MKKAGAKMITEMALEDFYNKWVYRDPGECPTFETFKEWLENQSPQPLTRI